MSSAKEVMNELRDRAGREPGEEREREDMKRQLEQMRETDYYEARGMAIHEGRMLRGNEEDELWLELAKAGASIKGTQDFSWKRAADKAREIVADEELAKVVAWIRTTRSYAQVLADALERKEHRQ